MFRLKNEIKIPNHLFPQHDLPLTYRSINVHLQFKTPYILHRLLRRTEKIYEEPVWQENDLWHTRACTFTHTFHFFSLLSMVFYVFCFFDSWHIFCCNCILVCFLKCTWLKYERYTKSWKYLQLKLFEHTIQYYYL